MKKKKTSPFKKSLTFISEHKKVITLLCLTILFFSFSIILTYDSAHYLGYVSIFERNAPASSWDIVRGPVFPILIRLSDIFFGKTSTGILILSFLFYLSFALICSILCKDIAKHYKRPKLFHTITTAILILNPLIFGYFHVLLTEFVAITITMLNILLAYKWVSIDIKNKKTAILYYIYFIFTTVFCWHLKQPYIIIALIPTIIACIIAIINDHKKPNLTYRIGAIIASIVFLFLSIVSWNGVLDIIHANKNSGRDASSTLGNQLAVTYQIDDGEEKNISSFINEAIKNPGKVLGIYFRNYCSLISLCKVSSPNGVDYTSTNELDLLETYENTAIGYATYNRSTNIFYIKEAEAYDRASKYATTTSRSKFGTIINFFSSPTNILFKLSGLLCFPVLIAIIIIRAKTKNKEHKQLLYLTIISLSTASCHLAFSAIALVIDRYAIEAFVPACLGIVGAITYIKLTFPKKQLPKTTSRGKKHA